MKLGFLGGGNMAGAIVGGLLRTGHLAPHELAVCDLDEQKRLQYAQQGIATFTDAIELAGSCRFLVLAVKPQNCAEVLGQIAPHLTPESVVISIAAGISASFIKAAVGFDVKTVLAMPNTPLLIGQGATAISCTPPTTPEELAFAKNIFACAGHVEEIAPECMREVIPLNGSSPAFIYEFCRLFVEQGVALGFSPEVANRLFCHSLIGAAQMMLQSGKSHRELIDMVCSPGGTTRKGMDALEAAGLARAVDECTKATVQRAYELGQ